MSKEVEQFKQLFENHPNIAILNINNDCDNIKSILEKLVNGIGGNFTNKEFSDIDQQKFRLTAREYEYVVVCDCFHELIKTDKFIDQVYHSLENSAHIILISNKQNTQIQNLIEILENADFRAINAIDIFDEYNLVMGKKMHMWGNGL